MVCQIFKIKDLEIQDNLNPKFDTSRLEILRKRSRFGYSRFGLPDIESDKFGNVRFGPLNIENLRFGLPNIIHIN